MTVTRTRADRVMRTGAWITVAGLVFTAIAMVPLVATGMTLPAWWWFLAMFVGVGLVVVFVGLVMAARQRSRRARAISTSHGPTA